MFLRWIFGAFKGAGETEVINRAANDIFLASDSDVDPRVSLSSESGKRRPRGPKDSASSFDSTCSASRIKQSKATVLPDEIPDSRFILNDDEEDKTVLEFLHEVDDGARRAVETLQAASGLSIDPESLVPWRRNDGGNWHWQDQMSRLDIFGVEIGPKEAAALATLLSPRLNPDGTYSFPEPLKTLSIHSVWLGPEAAAEIAAIIKPRVEAAGACLPRNTTLLEMDLQGNCIGDAGVSAIADCMDAPHGLKTLWLPSNGITARGIAALVPRIWVPSPTDNEEPGSEGAVDILGLGSNKLGDEGLEIICKAMEPRRSGGDENSSWEFLNGPKSINLWGNGITDLGAQALIKALEPRANPDGTMAVNGNLESIALFRNKLTAEIKEQVEAMAENITALRGCGATPLCITC